jgi:hypothetical protein
MNRACATALAALVLCRVAPAAAQDQLVTTFVPDAQRRWDAAWFVGWRGVDKSQVAPEWDEWYDVAAFSASAGHYLTPHVKIDLDVSTTTTGRVYGQEQFGIPGPFPYFQLRSYGFRRTTVAPSLAYQFFENRWVHPFLGAGIEGIREAEWLDVQVLPPGGPRPSPPTRENRVRYSARPFITGGVKFYVSERAFIRTDMLSTFSSGGAESAVWRIGAGVDF